MGKTSNRACVCVCVWATPVCWPGELVRWGLSKGAGGALMMAALCRRCCRRCHCLGADSRALERQLASRLRRRLLVGLPFGLPVGLLACSPAGWLAGLIEFMEFQMAAGC